MGRGNRVCRLRHWLACLSLCAGAAAAPVAAQAMDRDLVEAAYVINFLRYSEWPRERSEPADAPYRLLVLGPAADVRALRRVAREAAMPGERPIRVTHLRGDPEDARFAAHLRRGLDDAHAIFVAEPEHPLIPQIVELASRRPVLTIGVGAAFAQAGGMLALIEEGTRLAFTCNEAAILRSPVMVSTKVLRIARPLLPSSSLDGERRRLIASIGPLRDTPARRARTVSLVPQRHHRLRAHGPAPGQLRRG